MAFGDLTLELLGVDELVARAAEGPGILRAARLSALKSVGSFFQQRLKEYPWEGHWSELNPHTGVIDRAKRWVRGSTPRGLAKNFEIRRGRGKKRRRLRHIESNRRDAMAKLRRGVRYMVPPSEGFVEISFLRAGQPFFKLQRLAGIQEEARSFAVTERMSRFFFGIGFPVPAGRTLIVPARPWFGPVFARSKDAAFRLFMERFYGAANHYWLRRQGSALARGGRR